MASLVLVERWATASPPPAVLQPTLQLSLSADQRTGLRGHRRSDCGCDLLLQLPRGNPLEPGELLLDADHQRAVQVLAAPEPLLRVSAPTPRELLQAAYHLGNRHVALELRSDHLLLLHDHVLFDLLRHRGLQVEAIESPFLPEAGAYGGSHGHHH